MKKIKLESIGEEITYEKLENGLEVYLFNKEGCSNNYVTFTTKFGAINSEFVPILEPIISLVEQPTTTTSPAFSLAFSPSSFITAIAWLYKSFIFLFSY